MSNNNTVINAGVELVNKSRQAQVELEAQSLVNQILDVQRSNKMLEESSKLEQEALKKLSTDLLTQKDVLGTEWSGTLNMNQQTILKSLETMNKSKQDRVALNSQAHIQRIESNKAGIEANNKRIAELREKITKLAVEVVTPAQVVG